MVEDARGRLRADCGSCFGLCCVALPFGRSADFAFSKAVGEPCRNLQEDFGCGIHATLREDGFRGCTVYDCFGAGQQVAQVTYGGRDWRHHPETAWQMYSVFAVVRVLHELLWYLDEARSLPAATSMAGELRRAAADTERLTALGPDELETYDVKPHRQRVAVLLRRASALARENTPGEDLAGIDLIGAKRAGSRLRGASLRSASLIGADLSGADLRLADLIGADLRDADLSGADLHTALFVTQLQVNSARGDSHTRIPAALTRPGHWTDAERGRVRA